MVSYSFILNVYRFQKLPVAIGHNYTLQIDCQHDMGSLKFRNLFLTTSASLWEHISQNHFLIPLRRITNFFIYDDQWLSYGGDFERYTRNVVNLRRVSNILRLNSDEWILLTFYCVGFEYWLLNLFSHVVFFYSVSNK